MVKEFFRRVVTFILLDEANKVLLQHRTEDAKILPGYWGFFGGGIEGEETPEQAVEREAEEELGIKLKSPRLFRCYEFDFEGHLYEMCAFLDKLRDEVEDLKQQQREGQSLGLFTIDDALGLKMIGHDKIVLRDLKSFLANSSAQFFV